MTDIAHPTLSSVYLLSQVSTINQNLTISLINWQDGSSNCSNTTEGMTVRAGTAKAAAVDPEA